MTWPADSEQRGQLSLPPGGRVARGCAVVGFDATAASQNALAYAIGWGHRVGGRLDVVHVVHDDWQWALDACAVSCVAALVPGRDNDLSSLAAGLLAGTDLTWTYHTARGDIAGALEQRAEHLGADIIVIGRSSPQRLRPLWSNVAHRLLSRTNRIVVVVP